MNIFRKFRAYLQLREAIRKAEKARKENGSRYYVMPSSNGKLLIVDRKNFRILKSKGYINRNASVRDLVRECFYCTAYPNGNGYLRPEDAYKKRLQYFAWCDAASKRH